MLAPLIPYAIQDAVWYQIESNHQRAFQNHELLPNMINDWCTRWNLEFSLCIVQLARCLRKRSTGNEATRPAAHQGRAAGGAVPDIHYPAPLRAFVTHDIGEEQDIHPKKQAGARPPPGTLGPCPRLWPNQNRVQGPHTQERVVEGGRVRIHFDHLGGGLKTPDGGELKHFKIAGQDQKWAWSAAKIEGSEVLVSSSAVPTQSAFVMPGPLGRKAPT